MARFSRRAAMASVAGTSLAFGVSRATATPECLADSNDESCSANQKQNTNNGINPNQCALYLAPSTLPKANLGLFSGIDIPAEELVNDYVGGTFPGHVDSEDAPYWDDLYVPVEDYYKALPYRGQQLFPSWLAYILPSEPGAFFNEELTNPVPSMPREMWAFDEGFNNADNIELYSEVWDDDTSEDENWDHLKVSAFVPGILSLANSHPFMDNLEMTYDNIEKDETISGSFTPHHGVAFRASKTVMSGMELFLNYGEYWHETNDEKMEGIKYKGAKLSREKKGFVEGIPKKWDIMIEDVVDELPRELPTEKARRESLKRGKVFNANEVNDRPYSEYRENTYRDRAIEVIETDDDEEDKEDEESQPTSAKDIVKPISWIEKNGVCLSSGNLYVDQSTIPHAGRGVLANADINAGEVILVSPLIAMRRDDFKIYLTDPDSELVSRTVDKTTVVGEELLLNYAFGHPESPMLLVPTAPLTNFINHATSSESNVRIRWPDSNSNAAKLFDWVFHNHGHLYSKFDENDNSLEHNPWLKMHPIDVMERSGKLGIEYEAIRPIRRNEEILIDYGTLWEEAWKEYVVEKSKVPATVFRHYIQVPTDFYPPNWCNVSGEYEIAETKDLKNKPLEPGKVLPLTWAHNGKPVSSKNAYVIGLPKGFSDRFLEYAEKEGIIPLARRLLTQQDGYALPIDGFHVYNPHDLGLGTNATKDREIFGHRYKSYSWGFNMHYVAAWNELARKSFLEALGEEGFDVVLQGIGERFGYDNITCFHATFMAVSHCDQSRMHLDTWATGDKSWNLFFPVLSVEQSDPELDIFSDNMNAVIGVNYLKDVIYAIGDHGYHQTRPSNDYDPENTNHVGMDMQDIPLRVTFNAYCAHIDETNIAMIRYIYEQVDATPFLDQLPDVPTSEIHWDRWGTSSLKNPGGG